MTLTIEATYENGVLKPAQPLPLLEHEKVRITVEAAVSHVAPIGWFDRLDRQPGRCRLRRSES